jgi:fructose-bisphosphate aldolase class II
MAFISLRQLLDHAAEHGYGVPAFNINNLEQIHAIMQAAEAATPGHPAGQRRCPQVRGRAFLRQLVEAAVEQYPHIPLCLHQDHGATAGGVPAGHPLGLHQRDDGRLAARRQKTPASYDYNVAVTRKVVEMAMRSACRWKANSAAWARWRPAPPARRTAWAPKARWTTTSC